MSKQQHLDQKISEAHNEHFFKLCFEVFEQNAKGKELLSILKESLIEMSPVAEPGKEASYAYFREGQNHVIRSLYANIEIVKQKMKDSV